MNSYIKIYIPAEHDVSLYITHSCMGMLSDFFGGATSYKALGIYKDMNNQDVKEDIFVVESHMDEKDLDHHYSTITDFILRVKKQLKQESMAFEHNGNLKLL